VLNEFRSRVQVELRLDARAIRLHGLDRQVQALRDFSGSETAAGQFEDLKFAIGQNF
jgi:hypothetical protein